MFFLYFAIVPYQDHFIQRSVFRTFPFPFFRHTAFGSWVLHVSRLSFIHVRDNARLLSRFSTTLITVYAASSPIFRFGCRYFMSSCALVH